MRASIKWDKRFLSMARMISEFSKDPSTKVGAVIVRPNRTIASMGYNGFPRGIKDSKSRLENREIKYGMIIHAEINAILNAREPLDGYSLYVWPPVLYSPTCESCCIHVIQSGIKRVVGYKSDKEEFFTRWEKSLQRASSLYREAGVSISLIELD